MACTYSFNGNVYNETELSKLYKDVRAYINTVSEPMDGEEFPSSATVGVATEIPGVYNVPNSGLTIEQSNAFIDLLQPQIKKQAYVENKAKTANYMFSFGLRWARTIPNNGEKSKQGEALGRPRPNKKAIKSKESGTYGYFTTDQNNNALPPITDLQPIMDFIQSKLGIDLSNYDAMLGNIYDDTSFISQHRDTTESITAENYPVVVINLGSNGHLEYDKDTTSTYAQYKKSGQLDLSNGGIYAFGVDGVNRFTFHHRIGQGLESANPLKPITLPDGTVLKNYRITLTFRRASDLEPGMPDNPNKNKQTITYTEPTPIVSGFQGYKGGFEDKGKGTPKGDGKDKAMREVADSGFIGELDTTTGKESSTLTSFNLMSPGATVALTDLNKAVKQFPVIALKPTGNTIMLARNKELINKPLSQKTKDQILSAKVMGKEFVVGDMPGVDSQFIDYLQEIGAKFTVYHTGNTPRIQVTATPAPTGAPLTAEEIYAQLGNKTKSENVILPKDLEENTEYTSKNFWNDIVPEAKSMFDYKFPGKKPMLIAYRGNKKKTFLQNYKDGNTVGNPFDFADETGTRKEQGIKSTKKFIEWMITGNNFGNTNATEEYRQAIISDIKLGKIIKSPILYYEEKNYATHATALDYLINKYDWSKPTLTTVTTEVKEDLFNSLTDFTSERKEQIISGFSAQFKLTREQALANINDALQIDREGTINLLKECY